jgi:hypothetical protein
VCKWGDLFPKTRVGASGLTRGNNKGRGVWGEGTTRRERITIRRTLVNLLTKN